MTDIKNEAGTDTGTEIKNDIELSGSQLLYDRPEALHSAVHADLRFHPERHSFANVESLHLVPLLVGEFSKAMVHYPIVFAGPEKTPLAVMGLTQGQNLFVTDGAFDADSYVPAYLRRYPFTLAGTAADNLVVCIDRSASGFSTKGKSKGEALFDNGEPTAFTKNAMAFLDEFEVERQRTQLFVEMLTAAELFEVKNTLFISGGKEEHIADYFAVSEDKLQAVADTTLGDLVRRGAMAAIDMHLASLQRWDDLIARRNRLSGAPTPATDDTASKDAKQPQTRAA